MPTNLYIGKSFYPYHVLVKCSCGSHLIEIFAGKLKSDNINDFGISYYGEALNKKAPTDFYFKNYVDFKKFVDTLSFMNYSLQMMGEHLGSFKQSQVFTEHIINKRGKNIGGLLGVSLDEFGFINIEKYTSNKKSAKLVWDFILSNRDDLQMLINILENICSTIFDKEYKKEEVNI
jgi:hypothetical protein